MFIFVLNKILKPLVAEEQEIRILLWCKHQRFLEWTSWSVLYFSVFLACTCLSQFRVRHIAVHGTGCSTRCRTKIFSFIAWTFFNYFAGRHESPWKHWNRKALIYTQESCDLWKVIEQMFTWGNTDYIMSLNTVLSTHARASWQPQKSWAKIQITTPHT